MPEIGEVSRVVHYLKKHLSGRRIASIKVQDDPIVYGKVGTTAAAFAAALKGKSVLDARQQGKYFWLVMSSPPHPLMHLGMTGWLKFSNEETFYYKAKLDDEKSAKKKAKDFQWPPDYWKFMLKMEGEPECEAAFVDGRRLARIRLVDVPADEMRQTTPLKENGPDPVIDKDVLTIEWLTEKLRKKKVPVKAALLDQAFISGVGNWVGDEVLYNARIHPEQYSNTLNDDQIKQLHKSLMYVCDLACTTLADSDQFPEEWLFKHRWGKGKKNQNVLPNGEKITYLTVGGRTSAVVASVQKKTGPVAGDVDENAQSSDGEEDTKASTKTKAKGRTTKSKPAAKSKRKKAASSDDEDSVEASDADLKDEMEDVEDGENNDSDKGINETTASSKSAKKVTPKRKVAVSKEKSTPTPKKAKTEDANTDSPATDGRRRSGRLRKA